MIDGFLYTVAWNNPYTDPPNGKRVLAEMFVLRQNRDGSRTPPEIQAYRDTYGPPGSGYGIHIQHVGPPTKPKPPEVRASIRQKRLAARMQAKVPLFAEQFIADELDAKPDYYIRGISDADDAYQKALAWEQEIYDRLLSEHGKLIIL
jgi:hypothetical protein